MAPRTIAADQATTNAWVEHLMGWIGDDLHVRRRRIWQEISDDLGNRSQRLDNGPAIAAPPPADS